MGKTLLLIYIKILKDFKMRFQIRNHFLSVDAKIGENELVMVVRKEGQKLEQNIVPYEIIEEEREKNKREIKSGKKLNFPSNSYLTTVNSIIQTQTKLFIT
jgi:hypothetical protein